ncbi:MAG: hypothetical protein MSJ26_11285 [Oscillospiraceae bacterium]|nr:hypothetical protein [Oscillospiraceae bacterium]
MKKIIKIIGKYPPAALLLIIADICITEKYAEIAALTEPLPVKYYIVLYGFLVALLLFIAGWLTAAETVNRKEAERRRRIRRRAVYSSYSREFYGITDKL